MSHVRVSYDGLHQAAVIDVDHGDHGYSVHVPDSRCMDGTPLLLKFEKLCSLLTSNGVSAMEGKLTPEIHDLIGDIQHLVNQKCCAPAFTERDAALRNLLLLLNNKEMRIQLRLLMDKLDRGEA